MRKLIILLLFTLFFFIRITDVSAQTKEVSGISEAVIGSSGLVLNVMKIFISPAGIDKWSGKYMASITDKSDSPFTSIQRALELISFLKGYSYNVSLIRIIKKSQLL